MPPKAKATVSKPVAVFWTTILLFCAVGTEPAPVASAEQRIRDAINATNMGEQIISIKVTDSAFDKDGNFATEGPRAKMVDVVFEAAENLTKGMTKDGIELDMQRGYEAMFTKTGVPIARGGIDAHMMLVDRYGEGSLGLVYGTTLQGDTAARVNWENKLMLDWSNLWTVYFARPEFR